MFVLRALNRFIVRTSASLPLFLSSMVLGYGALFLALLPLMKAFRAATGGLMPIDWQIRPAPEAILAQVAQYSDAARDIYQVHAFVDFLAPPAIATFCGSIAAWSLRHGAPRLYVWIDARHLFALFYCSVPFDFTENIACLIAIFGNLTPDSDVVAVIPYANGVKMTLEPLLRPVTEAIMAVSLVLWTVQHFRQSKKETS